MGHAYLASDVLPLRCMRIVQVKVDDVDAIAITKMYQNVSNRANDPHPGIVHARNYET
jgi:hypothetical protein